MSGNQQNLCFSVTIHKLTGYLRFTVYPQQLRHLGYITGFQIPPNTCGSGLTIFHYGTIIVGNATLGENCTLFPGVLIGKKNKYRKEFCSEYGVNYDSHLKIQPSSFRLRRVAGSTASIQRHTLRGSSSA